MINRLESLFIQSLLLLPHKRYGLSLESSSLHLIIELSSRRHRLTTPKTFAKPDVTTILNTQTNDNLCSDLFAHFDTMADIKLYLSSYF